MDIERGNIEIVFQKIPYMYVIKSQQEMVDYCSYSKMEKDIYMRYSSDVFSYATDEIQNVTTIYAKYKIINKEIFSFFQSIE